MGKPTRRIRGIGPPSPFHPAGAFRNVKGWWALPKRERVRMRHGAYVAAAVVVVGVCVIAALLWLIDRL